jgi:hypothetical protein
LVDCACLFLCSLRMRARIHSAQTLARSLGSLRLTLLKFRGVLSETHHITLITRDLDPIAPNLVSVHSRWELNLPGEELLHLSAAISGAAISSSLRTLCTDASGPEQHADAMLKYRTGFFCACARYAIVRTYRRQLQVNSSELTLCSAEMAVRSGQALTSTILCITSPTPSTTQLYPTSSRASGVSKTMWNRSKAHHQSRPRFELRSLPRGAVWKAKGGFLKKHKNKDSVDCRAATRAPVGCAKSHTLPLCGL